MSMALVKGNEVILDYLPSKYELNGQAVANYHLLDKETLLAEGWLPLINEKPEYDYESEELIVDSYDINSDSVVKNYKVVAKEKTENERLKEELETAQEAIDFLIMSGGS